MVNDPSGSCNPQDEHHCFKHLELVLCFFFWYYGVNLYAGLQGVTNLF